LGIAKLYGMISLAQTSMTAVRTVFFIDNRQILRAILYYSLEIGKNIPEMLRVLVGLQTVNRTKSAIPADWLLGMSVVVPPLTTIRNLKLG